MYKTIIINSNLEINKDLLDGLDYIVLDNIELISTYKLKHNGQIYDFDYLILDSKINNTILSEDGYIITNDCFETCVDNYFAIGSKVKTLKSIDEQFSTILEYIKGNI
jgi:thioredoxin reductase